MPVTALETGLYNALSGDSSLTTELGGTLIYNQRAKQPAPDKYVIFQWQGGGDQNDTKQRTRNLVYSVFGVAKTKADAATIDGLIDAVLHNGSLTISGWSNYWLARESDINFVEDDASGVPRFTVGGLYRIRTEDT